MTNELAVRYEVDGQSLEITEHDVKAYLCDSQAVTDKEVRMFLELCKAQKLNPFVKDAYLIKYGTKPATIVVGKDVFTKRAQKNPRFKGYQAGLTVLGTDGGLHRREGSMFLNGESLVGAWCKVYVDGYDTPMYDEVSYQEYVGLKYDNNTGTYVPNAQWASKPGTMLRKVSIVHALREAFPEDLQGLYDEAEMGNLEPNYEVAQKPEIIEPSVEVMPQCVDPQTGEILEMEDF